MQTFMSSTTTPSFPKYSNVQGFRYFYKFYHEDRRPHPILESRKEQAIVGFDEVPCTIKSNTTTAVVNFATDTDEPDKEILLVFQYVWPNIDQLQSTPSGERQLEIIKKNLLPPSTAYKRRNAQDLQAQSPIST